MVETGSGLAGRSVLLVEDEYFLAADLSRSLELRGACVVGPVGTLSRAEALVDTGAFDIAVIDLNLHGEQSFPIADVLLGRGVPFVFATGYGREALPPRFADVPRWEKPFDIDQLMDALGPMITGVAPPAKPVQG